MTVQEMKHLRIGAGNLVSTIHPASCIFPLKRSRSQLFYQGEKKGQNGSSLLSDSAKVYVDAVCVSELTWIFGGAIKEAFGIVMSKTNIL